MDECDAGCDRRGSGRPQTRDSDKLMQKEGLALVDDQCNTQKQRVKCGFGVLEVKENVCWYGANIHEVRDVVRRHRKINEERVLVMSWEGTKCDPR